MNPLPQFLLNESAETAAEARHYDTPERMLRKAVLDRALCDYLQTCLTDRHIVRQAEQWIFHGKPQFNKHSSAYWPMTFLEICNELGLSPTKIRFFVKLGRDRFKGIASQGGRAADAALDSLTLEIARLKKEQPHLLTE